VTRLFTIAELAAIEDCWCEARRFVMRHDDAFYGPMKGWKCGCNECKWARRYIALADEIMRDHARDVDPGPRMTTAEERCPDDGRYGVVAHEVVDGRCYTCAGEEAARRARLEEKGIFVGR
jgi:hypothetical protein